MKLKNKDILNFINADVASKKLPVKLGYALSVNLAAVEPAFKAYNDQRTKLVEECAKKDENGKPLIEDNNYIFEDISKWNESILELLEAEADVNVSTVSLDILEKCDDPAFDKLSVIELASIKFMIAE